MRKPGIPPARIPEKKSIIAKFVGYFVLAQKSRCAERLISAKSRFISYSLSRSSSSCSAVSRWIHRCLTAPYMCRGHPTGICDSSRSPSPFCSIISPSIGTSIEVFRLIRDRLHCHVSGEVIPVWPVLPPLGKKVGR